jgi:hypothetical protein
MPASLHEASLRDLLSHPAEGFVVTCCPHLPLRLSLIKGVSFSHLGRVPWPPDALSLIHASSRPGASCPSCLGEFLANRWASA